MMSVIRSAFSSVSIFGAMMKNRVKFDRFVWMFSASTCRPYRAPPASLPRAATAGEFACATFSIAAEVLSVYSIFQCG